MKLVLDTNILVSALVFSGVAADIFEEAVRKHEVYLTEEILKEFTRIVQKKLKVPKAATTQYAKHLRSGFFVVSSDNSPPEICRDPKDNLILQLADFVSADFIITGDKDLLVLEKFGQTIIVDMRTFRAQNPSLP
ncbi:MAG: putative toxin-antitoxin system toxin component, PIN family [Leptospirales bacterium]|nr:putative toxin-antitoxin system toxin component, PIN family [Leptospirales bacterium]